MQLSASLIHHLRTLIVIILIAVKSKLTLLQRF